MEGGAVDVYGNDPYITDRKSTIMCQSLTKVKRKRMPPAQGSKTYRFDERLNEEQKLLIQRAADLQGRNMTDFVLQSAEAAAEKTLQDRAILILSARETEAFVDAILRPADPGPVLRKAVRAIQETVRLPVIWASAQNFG
jgi:uncharacterized protein (DUF1778 family)